MNNPIKLLISGADMGGLIASCALRHDFHESSRQEDRFHIYRIEKDTLTVEDVAACDLSGIRYAVNATLHNNEASFAFDEKCKEQGITVIHAVNLGKAAFLAVEKPKGYPFSEVVKKETDDFRCSLGKYISQYGMFWQIPVPWVDEAIRHYSEESFPHRGIYCRRLLCLHSREPCGRQGGEMLPQVLSLAIVGRDMIAIISSDSSWHETAPRQCSSRLSWRKGCACKPLSYPPTCIVGRQYHSSCNLGQTISKHLSQSRSRLCLLSFPTYGAMWNIQNSYAHHSSA